MTDLLLSSLLKFVIKKHQNPANSPQYSQSPAIIISIKNNQESQLFFTYLLYKNKKNKDILL